MTASINASVTSGVVVSGDTSGSLALQTVGVPALTISSSQVITFANPPSINLSSATGLPLTTGVTGTLPVVNGGTGLSAVGNSGNVLTSNGTAWVSSPPVVTTNGKLYFFGQF